MKELLKVSIIIPVHNSGKTLIRCVDSILSQKYKNIECILIENGSIDNSRFLCSKLAEQHDNIFFESIEDVGVSSARNMGLSLATGKIIGFCDADDFLEEDAIDSIVKEFANNSKIAIVIGGYNFGELNKNNLIDKKYRGVKERVISATKALQLILINDLVMGSVWNKYYRTDFLKNVSFDKTLSFCEDMHFNALVFNSIAANYYVKVISKPLYCYMNNLDSMTHNEKIFFDENDNLKYILALKKIDSDCVLDSKTESYLKMKIACFAVDFMTHKIDENKKKKLYFELRNNYKYIVRNLFVNNWKWNVKRVVLGFKLLVIK